VREERNIACCFPGPEKQTRFSQKADSLSEVQTLIQSKLKIIFYCLLDNSMTDKVPACGSLETPPAPPPLVVSNNNPTLVVWVCLVLGPCVLGHVNYK